MSNLHKLSVYAKNRQLKPYGMDFFEVTKEQYDVVQNISLDIFTDMSNAGYSLQETLSAIYFSGVKHALTVTAKGKLI